MKKLNILLVNWGTPSAIFPLKESLKLTKYNFFLATTHDIPKQINQLFTKEKLIYTNPYDEMSLCEDISNYSHRNNITFDVVTTFFEMNVYQTAFLADYLKCSRRLSLFSACNTSVNKYLMRTNLKQRKILQPQFAKFSETNIEPAISFLQQLNNSYAVIKPVHSGHSYGARKIDSKITRKSLRDMVNQAKSDLFNNYDEWMNYTDRKDINFLIEEYIPGKIFSFDGVVEKAGKIKFINSAEFEMAKPPVLQQIGHIVPVASLNKKQIKKCLQYTKAVINALQLEYCGFHCELKFDNNQPYLIEISGRLPGGEVLESYQATSEFNIFDQFFSIFEKKVRKVQINKSAYISEARKSFSIPRQTGKITRIKINRPSNSNIVMTSVAQKLGTYIDINNDPSLWICDIKLQSSSCNSKKLQTEIEKIVATIEFTISIDYGLQIRLKINRLKNKLKKLIVKTLLVTNQMLVQIDYLFRKRFSNSN